MKTTGTNQEGRAGSPLPAKPRRASRRRGTPYVLTLAIFLLLGGAPPASAQAIYLPYSFTNFAGLPGTSGTNDGTGTAARFYFPVGAAVDGAGNLYVGDFGNSTVRQITPAGVVTTIAGSPGMGGTDDGTNSDARFLDPDFVVVDGATNLYVSDSGYYSQTIRKLTHVGANWVVTTIAGSPGLSGTNDGIGRAARFNYPSGLAVDSATNLYVADYLNNSIRKLTPVGTNWVVTTLAGGNYGFTNGTGREAAFGNPWGLAIDSTGNLYVGDQLNYMVRKVTPAGVVTTVAGTNTQSGGDDGPVSTATFIYPSGMAVDGAGNIFVTDIAGATIRRISPDGQVRTLAGTLQVPGSADGTGPDALFSYPTGVAVDHNGFLYVIDYQNYRVTKGTPPPAPPDLGGSTYADSADFTLNTTGLSPIVGGASYSDSGDFTLNTTGTLPGTGGVASTDSPDFTLDTTGASGAYADSLDFILDTRGLVQFRLMNPLALPGGAFRFSFSNTPGVGFSVYAVTNVTLPLSNWMFLGTVTDNPPGQFQFTDPQGSNFPQRFYRVSSP